MKKISAIIFGIVSIVLGICILFVIFGTRETYSVVGRGIINIFGSSIQNFLLLIFFFGVSIFATVNSFIRLGWISIGRPAFSLQGVLKTKDTYSRIAWLILGTSALFLIVFFAYYYHVKSLEDLKESYRQEQVREDIQKFINAPLTR